MGNSIALFPVLFPSLLTDGELDARSAGLSSVCGRAACDRLSTPSSAQELTRVLQFTDADGEVEHLTIKLRKSTQLQLRALFQACKRETAAAAAAASSFTSTADAPPPPASPTVPVLSIRIRVLRGGLASAHMAVNRPFPSRKRHQWAWTPEDDAGGGAGAGGAGAKRKEPPNAKKTLGHQLTADGKRDLFLGPTGCVFDMHAAATEYFSRAEYFLALTSLPDSKVPSANGVVGLHKGGTSVEVTARVALRQLPSTHKGAGVNRGGVRSAEQQLADLERLRAWNAKQLARKAHEEEEERRAKEEQERRKKEWDDQRKATATNREEMEEKYPSAPQSKKPIGTAGSSQDEPDPFADDGDGANQRPPTRPLAPTTDPSEDPFASAPASAAPSQRGDDPFGDDDNDDGASDRQRNKYPDPFASLPPSPTRPTTGRIGRRDIPALPLQPLVGPTTTTSSAESMDSDRTDVLSDQPPPAARSSMALSPNLLDQLPTPQLAPLVAVQSRALSLAGTPILQPVRIDARVLDGLPDGALVPRPSVRATAPMLLTPEALSVPFESLPPHPPPPHPHARVPLQDVLAQEPTPRLAPARSPNEETISRVPSPLVAPVRADPRALEHVSLGDPLGTQQAPPLGVKRNSRILDGLPTPAVNVAPRSIDLLAQLPASAPQVLPPVPPMSVVRGAPPVDREEADAFVTSPDERARSQRRNTTTTSQKDPRPSPQRPIMTVGGRQVVQPMETRAQPQQQQQPRPSAFAQQRPAAAGGPPRRDTLDDLDDRPAPAASRPTFDDSLFDDATPTVAQLQPPPSSLFAQQRRPTTADLDDLLGGDEAALPAVPAYDPHALDSL